MSFTPMPSLEQALARQRAREAFKAGFTAYVGPLVTSQPDMYWNPRLGQWITLTSDKWQITDRGLQQTGIDYPADHFFDELMDGWDRMAAADRAAAVWSPSRQRWLVATAKGTGTGNGNRDLEKWLADLHELYVKGLITYPVYQRAVADALAGRAPTI
jgi:hypothetical protein